MSNYVLLGITHKNPYACSFKAHKSSTKRYAIVSYIFVEIFTDFNRRLHQDIAVMFKIDIYILTLYFLWMSKLK